VRLSVKLPPGARLTTDLRPWSDKDDGRSVAVSDRLDKGTLVLERVVDIPAGRIQIAGYPAFQAFARRADAALHREIVIALGGG
jgi:hypothetical protein